MRAILQIPALMATALALASAVPAAPPTRSDRVRPSREPEAGLLYYAKADFASAENTAVIANPHIVGALFQVIWSEVEREKGRPDWSELDRWIAPWLEAGKSVAIRIMWCTSGNWPKPYYKTPTPQWVWSEGAKFALHEPSGTEIPLFLDPVYKRCAWRFLEQFAARYDGRPQILFVDVTPGAETNPYRFGTIARTDPGFRDRYAATASSDGRVYGEDVWLATIKEWIDASDRAFEKTPLLVTLNIGGLRGRDRSAEIGDYCVSKGFYVGQNGLNGRSYADPSSGRASSFLRWPNRTRLFFEMVAGSSPRTGTLMEVITAAERIRCSYLNVYPEDVRRGTRGEPGFDPAFEAALAHGARQIGSKRRQRVVARRDDRLPERGAGGRGGDPGAVCPSALVGVSSMAELAQSMRVTRARMTRIMNLNHLAPEIQEALLFLPRTVSRQAGITERDLRAVAAEVESGRQRARASGKRSLTTRSAQATSGTHLLFSLPQRARQSTANCGPCVNNTVS